MYINLEGQEVEVATMTKAYLISSIARYEALCIAINIELEERKKLKEVKEELKTELAFRLKRKFRVIIDIDPI